MAILFNSCFQRRLIEEIAVQDKLKDIIVTKQGRRVKEMGAKAWHCDCRFIFRLTILQLEYVWLQSSIVIAVLQLDVWIIEPNINRLLVFDGQFSVEFSHLSIV